MRPCAPFLDEFSIDRHLLYNIRIDIETSFAPLINGRLQLWRSLVSLAKPIFLFEASFLLTGQGSRKIVHKVISFPNVISVNACSVGLVEAI